MAIFFKEDEFFWTRALRDLCRGEISLLWVFIRTNSLRLVETVARMFIAWAKVFMLPFFIYSNLRFRLERLGRN